MNKIILCCLIAGFIFNPIASAASRFSPIDPESYERIIAFRDSSPTSRYSTEYAYFREGRIYFADKTGQTIGAAEGYDVGQVFAKSQELSKLAVSDNWARRTIRVTGNLINGVLIGLFFSAEISLLKIVPDFRHILPPTLTLFESMTGVLATLCVVASTLGREQRYACERRTNAAFITYPRKESTVSLFASGFQTHLERLITAMDKDNCAAKLKNDPEQTSTEAEASSADEDIHE